MSKRQIAPLIVEGCDRHPGAPQSVRRIVEITATWSSFHLADDEYAARATAQKARELLGIIETMEAREGSSRPQEHLYGRSPDIVAGGRSTSSPVLFLYRHSIELLAKAVILSGNRLMRRGGAGQDERDLFASFGRSRHRLLPLLDSIKQVFEYAHWEWHWPKAAVGSFDDVRRVIEELDALDPASLSFRYPTNIRGERATSSGPLIGQRTILAMLDDLAESLDTAVFGLDAECSRM